MVLALVIILCIVSVTYAAYSIRRPITNNGGIINQFYLYGEQDGNNQHRGVDFPYSTGTAVYAVSDGTVVGLRENIANGTFAQNFGNYVMIRHTQRQYDRSAGQIAYVYSVYAHLSQFSVVPNVGDPISAGVKIAEVDTTGNTTGPHLHLQLNLSTDPNRTNPEDWGLSQNTSRNPELWLAPFNYSGTTTASAVGKVADANGNPVGGLRIEGMQKPASATSGTYGSSLTYAYTWANPDDLIVENFATTDVQPGTYHLQAKYPSGTLYRDLGNYTFVAGKTTFIGLSPIYLPSVELNDWGWNSSIIARNNSSRTSQVNSNFLRQDGNWNDQRTSWIPPHGSQTIQNPTCYYCSRSAQAFASEDAAAVVQTVYSGSAFSDGSAATAYTGAAAGSTTMYLPFAVYAPASGQHSIFTVQNTSGSPANITMTYINRNGTQDFSIQDSIPVFGQAFYDLNTSGPKIPVWTYSSFFNSNGYWTGAVIVTSDQPITAMLTNYWNNWVVAYDGVSSGDYKVFSPSAERRCTNCDPNGGTWQGFSVTTVQNLSAYSGAYVTLRYINSTTGNTDLTIANQYLAPRAAKGFNTRTGGDVSASTYNVLGGAWVGAVVVESNQQVAVAQYTIRPTTLIAGAYTGVHAGMAGVSTYLPAIYQIESGGNWNQWSIIRIQNPGTTTANNVDIYFYDQAGNLTWQILDRTIAGGAIYSHNTKNDNPPLGHNWTGSMLITSDRPLVAVVETLHTDDWMASYNGISR